MLLFNIETNVSNNSLNISIVSNLKLLYTDMSAPNIRLGTGTFFSEAHFINRTVLFLFRYLKKCQEIPEISYIKAKIGF